MSVPRSLLRGYTWVSSVGQYRRISNGRFVARSTILDLLQDSLNQRERVIIRHGQELVRGAMSGRNYIELEGMLLKRQTLQQIAVAAGGWDRFTPADVANANAGLAQIYQALGRQAQGAADGTMSAAQAANRVHMMMGDIQRMGLQAELAHRPPVAMGKMRIERRTLDPDADHCTGEGSCPGYAAMGWQPEGELPRPGEACQCVLGETVVESQGIGRLFRRDYAGFVVQITTAGGYQLTATPNHPIATPAGWVPIGALDEGQQLLCGGLAQGVTGGDPDIEHVPTPVGELFDTAALAFGMEGVPSLPMDFHGDGREQQVDVVRTDDALAHRTETLCPKQVARLLLSLSDLEMGRARIMPARIFSADACRQQFMVAAQGDACVHETSLDHRHGCLEFVRQGSQGPTVLIVGDDALGGQASQAGGRAVGDNLLVLRESPNGGPGGQQSGANDMSANPEGARQRDLGLPLGVATQQGGEVGGENNYPWAPFAFWLDRIARVERHWFVGHVYNLTTGWHYYTSAHVVTQNCLGNCRCQLEVKEIPIADVDQWIGQGGA